MKKISIFGSTGSIGNTTIDLLKNCRNDWQIFALTANDNVDLLIKQALELNPEYAIINNESLYTKLKESLANTKIKTLSGIKQLNEIAKVKCDIVLMAITGIAALKPTVNAIKSGSDIAIANKEAIVCAGHIIIDLAKKYNVKLLPVDSEHNAIFQLIDGKDHAYIDKIYLTASGGPFLKYSVSQMEKVTVNQALKHPNWQMGKKISIDSATMVNKSLELFEAHYLFNLPNDKIDIIIHPESIIHGMVDLIDGITLASMNVPDMTAAISYALNYPNRIITKVNKLDFIKLASLNFEQIDLEKFPSVKIARACLESFNKSANCIVYNSANEIAVENFLRKKIGFLDIVKSIEHCLEKSNFSIVNDIEHVYQIDSETRVVANEFIEKL